jgi:predicted MFS family arabinose efflux permease
LLLSPVVAWAIDSWGFRGGYLALAAITLGIGLPAVLVGVRPAPADVVPAELEAAEDAAIEAVAEGAPVQVATPELEAAAAAIAALERSSLAWRDALRTKAFWLLALSMVLVNAPSTGILTQLDPLLSGKGVNAGLVTFYIALFSASVLVGRIGVGMLFDRMSARRVAAVVTLGGGIGALLLTATAPMLAIPLAIVLVGLMQGAETDVLAWFVSRFFGQADYSTIYGGLAVASLLGTAGGVVGFGRLYDYSQNYDIALAGAAGMLAAAAITYLFLPKPKLQG